MPVIAVIRVKFAVICPILTLVAWKTVIDNTCGGSGDRPELLFLYFFKSITMKKMRKPEDAGVPERQSEENRMTHRQKMGLVKLLCRTVEQLAESYYYSRDSWVLMNRAYRLLARLVKMTRRVKPRSRKRCGSACREFVEGAPCRCCGRSWEQHCGGMPDGNAWRAGGDMRKERRRKERA